MFKKLFLSITVLSLVGCLSIEPPLPVISDISDSMVRVQVEGAGFPMKFPSDTDITNTAMRGCSKYGKKPELINEKCVYRPRPNWDCKVYEYLFACS